MSQSEKELENQLVEAGNKLLSPPSSVSELLTLLDRVEGFLTRVEQSPSESMNKALSPLIKAIVEDALLKHSSDDVKVAVASCISEITRITAPEAPYGDEQMKDVFQLIVSSFEKIDDKSSPSYDKRTNILETVAKVRSCVVMLDLECDGLILEMFQIFLRSIRDYHPENVFSSMETIMTLVFEESEDVSLDLVSSILDFLKTENKEALPIAVRLAEKVLEKSVSKLKPYLIPAVEYRGASLNDYSKVVANICLVPAEAVELIDGDAASKNLADESDFGSGPREKAGEVVLETVDNAPPSEEIGAKTAGSPKSVVSNGTKQKEIDDISPGIDSKRVVDHDNCDGVQVVLEPSKASVEGLNAGEKAKPKSKPVKPKKRKGKRTAAVKSSSKPSGSKVNDDKKEAEKLPEQHEGSKEVDFNLSEDAVADELVPARNNEEPEATLSLGKPLETENDNTDVTVVSPSRSPTDKSLSMEDNEGKTIDEVMQENVPVSDMDSKMESGKTLETENESADVTLPSPSKNPADECFSKEDGEGRKSTNVMQESVPGSDIDSKIESDSRKDSEQTDISESKLQKSPGKKKDDAVPPSGPVSENDSDMESDLKKAFEGTNVSETKPADIPTKKDEDTVDLAAESAEQPIKKFQVANSQSKNKKKKGQGKGTPVKTPLPKSTERSSKEESDVQKASSKTSSKRKRSSGKEKSSGGTKDHGEELVGSKIKVWWPDDKKFYYGVVESFDSVQMKHEVVYDDGDVENLRLAEEKWKLVEGEATSDQESPSDGETPDAVSETPKGKKVKTGEDIQTKQRKVETTAKKGATSSTPKATPKSGGKQKDDSSKVDGKPKEKTLKSIAKSSQKKGKSKDESSKSIAKPAVKSKDEDSDLFKVSKSKEDTPKGAPKSKGKSPKANTKPEPSPPKGEEDTPKGAQKSKGKSSKANTKPEPSPPKGEEGTPKGAPKSKGKSPKANTKPEPSPPMGEEDTPKGAPQSKEKSPKTNTKPEPSSPKGEEAQEKEKSSSEALETDAKEKSPSLSKIQKKRKRSGKR